MTIGDEIDGPLCDADVHDEELDITEGCLSTRYVVTNCSLPDHAGDLDRECVECGAKYPLELGAMSAPSGE